MLLHCHITNLAIVKNLDLDLQKGMTVITGETGAGKSIIFDAIRLCLGDKAEATLVRPGFDKAELACTFDVHLLPQALEWLKVNEFASEEALQECIVRRIIYQNGRSKAYINGCAATQLQLKALGECLIQIHGQHQHQSLLKSSEQLRLLDAFADHLSLVNDLQKAYKSWKDILLEKQNLLNSVADTNRLALLRYQVAELSDLNLRPLELEELDKQQNQLYHAQSDSQEAHHTLESLSEDVSSTLQKITDILKRLSNRHSSLQTSADLLIAADIQIQEAIHDLKGFCQTIEINPKQLQEVEQRLSTLYDVARKHKIRPEALIAHFEGLNTELEALNQVDERLLKIDEHLKQSEAAYLKLANSLSASRLKASEKLSKEIEAWLAPLGMNHGRFSIELIANEPAHHGLEKPQFCVSVNPGHPLQALNKVASGGELSRISLAIHLVLAHYLNTPTLIFDEVDVGVGGKIGAIIGQALQTLSRSVQVLCVTHLPQVAAFGSQHLQVTKHQNINETYTTIEPLECETRVEELARMLGGIEVTPEAREHAKGLLSVVE